MQIYSTPNCRRSAMQFRTPFMRTTHFQFLILLAFAFSMNAQAQVRLQSLNVETETVVVKNFGSVTEDISEYQFCLGPGQYNILNDYTNITGDLNLDPNEEVTIDLTSGSLGVTALPDDQAALILFSQANFGSSDPNDLKDFIQYGAPNQARVDQAVNAGRWDSADSFVVGASPFNYIGGLNNIGPNFWIDDTTIRLFQITPETDIVVVKNFDVEERDLTNYFFCTQAGVYPQLGNPAQVEIITGNLVLAPNEEVTVKVLTAGGVIDGNGSIFLFSSNVLGFNNQNPFVTRDFAQWGAPNGFRVDNAVATGRWDSADSFVDGNSPFNYIGDADDVGADFWQATDFDAIIRLLSLNTETETVVIKNFGSVTEDISDYQFCLGPGQYNILNDYTNITGDLNLDPNEEVTIDLTSGSLGVTALPDDQAALILFSQANFGSSNPEELEDFIQYGAPDQARVGQAVSAGRWDSADSFVDGNSPFNYIGDADDVGADFWQATDFDAIIRLLSLNTETETVVVKNFGSVTEDISDYQFCLGPGQYNILNDYTNITGDLNLDPNEEVTIDLTSGSLGVTALPDDQAALTLFSQANFGSSNPEELEDFIQYGAPDQARVGQAVSAGRWDSADSFVDGNSPFNYIGDADDVGADFWQATDIDAIIRLLSLNTATETVVIKNFGSVTEDISDYQFCLGPGQYNILNDYTNITGDLNLDPNEEVTIDLTSGSLGVTALPDDQAALILFSQANFGSSNPEELEDFIQYGAPDQARVGQAVSAGRWDSADSFVDGNSPFNYIGDADDVGADFWQATFNAIADLELSIFTSTVEYNKFQPVIYEIELTNNGPETATNIEVAAGLPDGLVFTDSEVSDGNYNLFFETWFVDQLPAGETATLTLTLFTLVEGVTITNFVQVTASDQDDPDSTPNNNNGNVPVEDDEAVAIIFGDVNVNQAPVADFAATPESGFAPLVVSFNATTSFDFDGSIVDFSFDFGDGNTATGATASNTYTTPGVYMVTLTVTDNDGATGTATKTITVFGQGEGMDLELQLTANPTNLQRFTTTTLTFKVTNTGTVAATDIVVSAPVPQGFAFTSSNAIQGNYNLFFQEWTIEEIQPGATATLELKIFVLSPSNPFTYYAQIINANPGDIDSTPNNNPGPTPIEDDEAAIILTIGNNAINLPNGQLGNNAPSLLISRLYPTPAESSLNLELIGDSEKEATIAIFGANGQLVKQHRLELFEGLNTVEMDISSLPGGIYFVRIPSEAGQTPVKFIKVGE